MCFWAEISVQSQAFPGPKPRPRVQRFQNAVKMWGSFLHLTFDGWYIQGVYSLVYLYPLQRITPRAVDVIRGSTHKWAAFLQLFCSPLYISRPLLTWSGPMCSVVAHGSMVMWSPQQTPHLCVDTLITSTQSSIGKDFKVDKKFTFPSTFKLFWMFHTQRESIKRNQNAYIIRRHTIDY